MSKFKFIDIFFILNAVVTVCFASYVIYQIGYGALMSGFQIEVLLFLTMISFIGVFRR